MKYKKPYKNLCPFIIREYLAYKGYKLVSSERQLKNLTLKYKIANDVSIIIYASSGYIRKLKKYETNFVPYYCYKEYQINKVNKETGSRILIENNLDMINRFIHCIYQTLKKERKI
jgi:hypothetical protein